MKIWTSDELADELFKKFNVMYSKTTDSTYIADLPVKFFLKAKPFFSSFGIYTANVNDCDNAAVKIKDWVDTKAYKAKLPAAPVALFLSYVTKGGGNHRAILAHTDEGWKLFDGDFRNNKIRLKDLSDITRIRSDVRQGIWD